MASLSSDHNTNRTYTSYDHHYHHIVADDPLFSSKQFKTHKSSHPHTTLFNTVHAPSKGHDIPTGVGHTVSESVFVTHQLYNPLFSPPVESTAHTAVHLFENNHKDVESIPSSVSGSPLSMESLPEELSLPPPSGGVGPRVEQDDCPLQISQPQAKHAAQSFESPLFGSAHHHPTLNHLAPPPQQHLDNPLVSHNDAERTRGSAGMVTQTDALTGYLNHYHGSVAAASHMAPPPHHHHHHLPLAGTAAHPHSAPSGHIVSITSSSVGGGGSDGGGGNSHLTGHQHSTKGTLPQQYAIPAHSIAQQSQFPSVTCILTADPISTALPQSHQPHISLPNSNTAGHQQQQHQHQSTTTTQDMHQGPQQPRPASNDKTAGFHASVEQPSDIHQDSIDDGGDEDKTNVKRRRTSAQRHSPSCHEIAGASGITTRRSIAAAARNTGHGGGHTAEPQPSEDEFNTNQTPLSKRDRNKISAMKYREKRKLQLLDMENKILYLEQQIRVVEKDNKKLARENEKLKGILFKNGMDHLGRQLRPCTNPSSSSSSSAHGSSGGSHQQQQHTGSYSGDHTAGYSDDHHINRHHNTH